MNVGDMLTIPPLDLNGISAEDDVVFEVAETPRLQNPLFKKLRKKYPNAFVRKNSGLSSGRSSARSQDDESDMTLYHFKEIDLNRISDMHHVTPLSGKSATGMKSLRSRSEERQESARRSGNSNLKERIHQNQKSLHDLLSSGRIPTKSRLHTRSNTHDSYMGDKGSTSQHLSSNVEDHLESDYRKDMHKHRLSSLKKPPLPLTVNVNHSQPERHSNGYHSSKHQSMGIISQHSKIRWSSPDSAQDSAVDVDSASLQSSPASSDSNQRYSQSTSHQLLSTTTVPTALSTNSSTTSSTMPIPPPRKKRSRTPKLDKFASKTGSSKTHDAKDSDQDSGIAQHSTSQRSRHTSKSSSDLDLDVLHNRRTPKLHPSGILVKSKPSTSENYSLPGSRNSSSDWRSVTSLTGSTGSKRLESPRVRFQDEVVNQSLSQRTVSTPNLFAFGTQPDSNHNLNKAGLGTTGSINNLYNNESINKQSFVHINTQRTHSPMVDNISQRDIHALQPRSSTPVDINFSQNEISKLSSFDQRNKTHAYENGKVSTHMTDLMTKSSSMHSLPSSNQRIVSKPPLAKRKPRRKAKHEDLQSDSENNSCTGSMSESNRESRRPMIERPLSRNSDSVIDDRLRNYNHSDYDEVDFIYDKTRKHLEESEEMIYNSEIADCPIYAEVDYSRKKHHTENNNPCVITEYDDRITEAESPAIPRKQFGGDLIQSKALSGSRSSLAGKVSKKFSTLRKAVSLDRIDKVGDESPMKKSPSLKSLLDRISIRKKKGSSVLSSPSRSSSSAATLPPTGTSQPKSSHRRSNLNHSRLQSSSMSNLDTIHGQLSNFRPIGKLLKLNQDGSQILQLVKPPHGPFGFYIARGNALYNHGLFISRLSDALPESFFAGLLSVGDEILEINGVAVKKMTLEQIYDIMNDLNTITLLTLPYLSRKDSP